MKKFIKLILVLTFILSLSFNFVLYFLLNSINDNSLYVEIPNDYQDKFFKTFPEELQIIESSRQDFLDDRYSIFGAYKDLTARNSSIWLLDRVNTKYYKLAESYNHTIYSSPKISPDGNKILFGQIYPFAILVTYLKDFSTDILVMENDKNSEIAPSISKDFNLNISWLNDQEVLFEDNQSLDDVIKKININDKKIEIYKTIKADTEKKEVLLEVPHFSQQDKLWSDEKLGSCNKHTIKSAGCAITSVTMILSYYNKLININPQTLNDKLSEANYQGYFNGCDIKWYIPIQFTNNLKFKWAYFNEFNIDRVHKELNKGNPIIVGFNKVPFTNLQHWAVIVGYKDGEYIINDPWDNKKNSKTLKDFGGRFDHMILYETIKSS